MTAKDDDNNLKAILKMEEAAKVLAALPTKMAHYFANGGAGVGQAVVGDRYQGRGNARFEALSYDYFMRKQKVRNKLNKAQKEKYGRGSTILPKVPYRSSGGGLTGYGSGKNLPILVLTGKMRAAVIGRKHPITQQGDTAIIDFKDLPDYAAYHQTGTSRMPQRSPVDPNSDDMTRVLEFADRIVSAAVGEGSNATTFGQGTPRLL